MDAKLQLNPVVLGDLKRAAQHVLDFFCQLGLVRLAMLFPLDASAFKVIDLLGKLAALFEQSRHDLEWHMAVGELASPTLIAVSRSIKSGFLLILM